MSDADTNSKTYKDVVSDFKRTLECPICLDMIKHPFKLCARGHLMCVGCLKSSSSCPTCQGELSLENPVCIKQLLEYLPHACRYSASGCERVVQDGNEHEKFCGFQLLKCKGPNCKQEIVVKEFTEHYTTIHPTKLVINDEYESISWGNINPNKIHDAHILVYLYNSLFWVRLFNNVEDRQAELTFEAIPIGKLDSDYYLNVNFVNEKFCFRSTLKAYIPEESESSDQRENVDRLACMKIPQEMLSHLINTDGELTAELLFFKR